MFGPLRPRNRVYELLPNEHTANDHLVRPRTIVTSFNKSPPSKS